MAAADPTPFGLTIADALRAAADRGFTAQFDAAAGGEVVQPADDRAFPAGQVSPRYLWRIDGASDVADQLLVVAVEATGRGPRHRGADLRAERHRGRLGRPRPAVPRRRRAGPRSRCRSHPDRLTGRPRPRLARRLGGYHAAMSDDTSTPDGTPDCTPAGTPDGLVLRALHRRVAYVFDFDETLGPNTTDALLDHVGVDPERFRHDRVQPRVEEGWEQRLAEASALAELSRSLDQPITDETFAEVADKLELYDGVEGAFDTLAGAVHDIEPDIEVEFHLITAGFIHIPAATSIAHRFASIIGGHWAFGEDGAILQPKSTVGHYAKGPPPAGPGQGARLDPVRPGPRRRPAPTGGRVARPLRADRVRRRRRQRPAGVRSHGESRRHRHRRAPGQLGRELGIARGHARRSPGGVPGHLGLQRRLATDDGADRRRSAGRPVDTDAVDCQILNHRWSSGLSCGACRAPA